MTTLVIDGSNLLHRALHATATADMRVGSQPTGGVYSAAMALRGLLDRFGASSCLVAWDGRAVTYRKSMMPAYKENRQPKTEAEAEEKRVYHQSYVTQRILLRKLFQLLGCQELEVDTAEADDVIYLALQHIGTASRIVVSDDGDLLQLVDERTAVFRPRSDELVDAAAFEAHVGVASRHFLLYRALVGDPSDNIAGVRGIGPVRAKGLLAQLPATDLVSIREWCSTHRSKSFRAVADSIEILIRNLHLMDLSRYPWDPQDVERVRAVLDSEGRGMDYRGTHLLLRSLSMGRILENYSSWVRPFRMLRSISATEMRAVT